MLKSRYTLSCSFLLLCLLCGAYAGVLASFAWVPLPVGLMGLFATIALCHFMVVIRRHVLLSDGVTSFLLSRGNRWELCVKGRWFDAELMSDTVVSSFSMILNFKRRHDAKKISIIVLSDSLSANQRSQLCWDVLRSFRATQIGF